MESRPSDPLRRPSSRPAISACRCRPPSAPPILSAVPLSAFPLVPAGRIPMNPSVTLSTTGLTAADVLAVARRGACVELDPAARERVAEVRAHVDELASGATPVYGVSTGFGALADTAIPTHMRQARSEERRVGKEWRTRA